VPSPDHSPELDFETHAAFMPPKNQAQTGGGRVQKKTRVPNPHQRITRQRKNDPSAQAPNTKSTKKANKAAPIAVTVPGAPIRPLKVNHLTSYSCIGN